ncbi:MAG TPA: hypothetical protein VHL98_07610 [Microvirga sp.]|jgi:hypothetical protein|nr:hypothetical protein [Microvirga sp.]
MRDAIRGAILWQLEPTDPAAAASLARDPALFKDLRTLPLSPQGRTLLSNYAQGAIAYSFTFDITETNNAGASLGFADPILRGLLPRGSASLGLSASHNRERQNTRNFRMVDVARDIVTSYDDEHCTARAPENWHYPITGSIGLDELVRTFYRLNESGKLSAEGANPVPTLADTLEFTTTLSGNATSTVQLIPIRTGFELTSAGANVGASRMDIHKVIIALTLPAKPVERAASRAVPAVARAAVSTRGRTATEVETQERALIELRRQEILEDELGQGDVRRLRDFLRDVR